MFLNAFTSKLMTKILSIETFELIEAFELIEVFKLIETIKLILIVSMKEIDSIE